LQRKRRLIDEDSELNRSNLDLIGTRNLEKVIHEHGIDPSRRSLHAATINNVRTLLTMEQMKDCAEAYANCGMLRSIVDKNTYFTKGDRTRFVIEPNDELTSGLKDQEIRKIEDEISGDEKYKQLRTDLLRLNKRVQLDDRLNKFLTQIQIFGRSFLEIERLKPDDPESKIETGFGKAEDSQNKRFYGEPIALKPLTPFRIEQTLVNARTYEFEGLYYNFGYDTSDKRTQQRGSEGNKKKIDAVNLVCGWYDDNNVFDSTFFSGMSPVWTVLSAAQTVEVALDQNIPEFLMAVAEGFGSIYTGTNKKSVATDIKNTLKHSTWFIHNYENLKMDKVDLARNPEELTTTVRSLCQYICQALNLPLFLVFEDTANFATANQVMQSYKVSTLTRHRAWLQGILEKYWYDPILADFYGIEVEDVIAQEVKIKPIFEDINFETRLEIIAGCQQLVSMGVYNPSDVAKDINNKTVQRRLEMEDAAVQQDMKKSIDAETGKETVAGPANPNVAFKSRKVDAQP